MEEIVLREFRSLPICGSDKASEKEHVPPERAGGVVITKTCEPCNNELGSQVEADLIDWLEDALQLRIEGAGVPGRRNVGRALIRMSPQGESALFLDGRLDKAVPDILRSGAANSSP